MTAAAPRTCWSARSRFSPRTDPDRAALLIDLGGVHREQGRFREVGGGASRGASAGRRCRRRAARGPSAGRPAGCRASRSTRMRSHGSMRRQGDGLEQALEAAGDHAGLAQLWHVRALLWWIKAQSGEAERAWRRAADEALQAGDERMLADAVGWEASSMAVGPTPVDAAIVRCQEIRAILSGDPWAEALALQPLASLHAMRGEFDDRVRAARRVLGGARGVRADGGRGGLASGGLRRRCWRAIWSAPSVSCEPAGASWSRWESGRCSPRPRATWRRCCS